MSVGTVSRNSISWLKSHCFFVGNCIGRRNRKAFFLFLLSGFLKGFSGILIGAWGIFSLVANNIHFFYHIFGNIKYIFALILSFFILFFLFKKLKMNKMKKASLFFAILTFYSLLIYIN